MPSLRMNRHLWFLLLLSCILIGLFAAGCSPQINDAIDDQKEDAMNNESDKPPIDRQMPSKIETATFALG